jgi:hypothetical protein
MPGRRSGGESQVQPVRGPQGIGRAINQRSQELNRKRLERAYRNLIAKDAEFRKPIQDAAKWAAITHEDKRLAIVGQRQIQAILAAHSVLVGVLWEGLENDGERGRRVQDSVERCLGILDFNEDAVREPHLAVVVRLAREFLSEVLSELKRLGVLDQCAYCRKMFFPTSPRKRRCSADYEGRDCASRQASRNYYQNTKAKKKTIDP